MNDDQTNILKLLAAYQQSGITQNKQNDLIWWKTVLQKLLCVKNLYLAKDLKLFNFLNQQINDEDFKKNNSLQQLLLKKKESKRPWLIEHEKSILLISTKTHLANTLIFFDFLESSPLKTQEPLFFDELSLALKTIHHTDF